MPSTDRTPSAAQDRLLATRNGQYAEGFDRGYDEGQNAIWDESVCSVCGLNHDRSESAMCEGAEVISFSDWHGRASDFLKTVTSWRGTT
jgi:hypothetical protein